MNVSELPRDGNSIRLLSVAAKGPPTGGKPAGAKPETKPGAPHAPTGFVITLQKTDVGHGRTTKGTSRRPQTTPWPPDPRRSRDSRSRCACSSGSPFVPGARPRRHSSSVRHPDPSASMLPQPWLSVRPFELGIGLEYFRPAPKTRVCVNAHFGEKDFWGKAVIGANIHSSAFQVNPDLNERTSVCQDRAAAEARLRSGRF